MKMPGTHVAECRAFCVCVNLIRCQMSGLPVMSAGWGNPIMRRIDGATSASRPSVVVASALDVT